MSESENRPSKLLFDECYAAEDDRFLDELTKFNDYHFLLDFVRKWCRDERPWARRQIIRYLGLDLNFPGHEVVFKRLFKHFEAEQDHELMAHFMVACDRLVRRTRRHRHHWHRGQVWTEETLFAKANKSVREQTNRTQTVRWGGRSHTHPLPDILNRPENRLFSNRTRNYLRRRVWRYFRRMSYRKPALYVATISAALCVYRDEDFTVGENMLDNRSLMHVCYYHHRALNLSPAHVNLAEAHSLGQLTPMPYQPSAWSTDKGSEALVHIISNAQSSLARLWAMELMQRDHQAAIGKIELKTLVRLLSHVDPRVQEFAAELFPKHAGLSSLRIESWLELLDQANHSVLALLCDSMRQHVAAERLDNAQLIALASARPVPVAEMGFQMMRERHASRPFSPEQLTRLSAVNCPRMAEEISAWALGQVAAEGSYDLDAVIEFFDSLRAPVRRAAMRWLTRDQSPGAHDPALWARLVETPFDDVKLELVQFLERRLSGAPRSTDDLTPVWSSVILGVHRGGRTKPKAVRQVAAAIADDPELAERLLPVLAVAVRSIRGPERRNALSAVVTLALRSEGLREALARHLPELQWFDETSGSTAWT